MKQDFSREFVEQTLLEILTKRNANVARTAMDRPSSIKRIDIPLDIAQLETDAEQKTRIGFEFKSYFVCAATDASTEIFLKPMSRDDNQGSVPLRVNSSHVFDLPINGAYLHWEAQPGKKISLIVCVDSEFRPGATISELTGDLSLTDGSSFDHSVITLPANTPTLICPAKGTRKVATFQNKTGGFIWIGKASVSSSGANQGLEYSAGDSDEWKSSAPLYAISVGGGEVVVMEQE